LFCLSSKQTVVSFLGKLIIALQGKKRLDLEMTVSKTATNSKALRDEVLYLFYYVINY
jgi:hypothetical protein